VLLLSLSCSIFVFGRLLRWNIKLRKKREKNWKCKNECYNVNVNDKVRFSSRGVELKPKKVRISSLFCNADLYFPHKTHTEEK
jgi:hypothetical protein